MHFVAIFAVNPTRANILRMKIKEIRSKFTSMYLWGNLLAMVLVMALLIFLTLKGLDIYTRHGENITVPSLKGMSSERAKITLESLGLKCNVSESGYMPHLPANSVLDQSVKQGNKVKEGRMVNITVNASTPPTIAIPDLADNSSLREAQSRLTAIGLSLTPTEYINGEKDWVYEVKCNGKAITAGERVSITSKITLVAGNGLTEEELLYREDSLYEADDYGEEINL